MASASWPCWTRNLTVPDQLDPFDEFLEHAISEVARLAPEEMNEVIADLAVGMIPPVTPMRNPVLRDG